MTDAPRHVVAKPGFLHSMPGKLDRGMVLLSFLWFLVIVTERVNGTSPIPQGLGTVLWASFALYFSLRLAIVSKFAG